MKIHLRTNEKLDIDVVPINSLSREEQKDIKDGRRAYRNGEWHKFLSFEEVFGK